MAHLFFKKTLISLTHFVAYTIFQFFKQAQHVINSVDVDGFGVCFEIGKNT